MNQQVLNVRLVNNAVLGSTEDSVGAHTVIGLLKQLYEKLRTSTGNTSINIGVIQGAIRNLENIVNGSTEVEPHIVGLITQIANINTEINGTNGLRSQISALENIINGSTEVEPPIVGLITEIASLKSRATSIEEINQQQTVKINDNEDDITALTNRVNAIDNSNDGRLTVVEQSVTNLVNEVEGQGGVLDDITDLQANVSILQQSINNLPPGGVGQSTNQTGGERFNLYQSNRNTASGDYSHAEGYLTNATGNYSHVEGSSTSASGESAHAEGNGTSAQGVNSHAEGYATIVKASANYAHAEGQSCDASGVASHVEGRRSVATGDYSHCEGYADNLTGYGARATAAHVEGTNCKADANNAHAEGGYTTASGSYAHAEGFATKALAKSSHAEGYHAEASGNNSHAEGEYTTASGYCSHAGGLRTIAQGQCMTVIGQFNTVDSYDSINSVNRLLVVGNGINNSSKSDAFVVKTSGAVIINSTRSGTTPSLTIGPNSKAITGTTAASASTYPNDAILTTKHYVDEKTNSLQHFIYYGPISINYVSEIVNVSLIDRTVTEFAIVYYDYNNGDRKASIIIPRLALDLTTGHSNIPNTATFAFGIIQMYLDYLGYRFIFNVNKPGSGIYFHPCRGICEGVYYDDSSNPANQSYLYPTVFSGILSTVPNNTQSEGDLIVYAYTPIRAANNYGLGYDAISGKQICFKITYNPNKITTTSL